MNVKYPLKGSLIDVLKALEGKEWRKLGEFVRSPVFNKNKKMILLYDLLSKAYPEFGSLGKECIFREMYPKQTAYKDASVRILLSDFMKLVRSFLSFLKYEEQESYQEQLLLKSLMDRRLNKLFEKQLKTFLKKQERKQQFGVEELFHQFKLEEVSFQQTILHNNRATETSLSTAVEYLDAYYLILKLQYAIAGVNRQKILNVAHHSWFLDNILEEIEEHPCLKNVPIIKIYYQLILLLKEHDSGIYYKNINELIAKYAYGIGADDLRHIYTVLFNYCTQQVNNGKEVFLSHIFDIYRNMLHYDVLEVNGYISPHHFKNIVTVGLKSDNLEWTQRFIKDYKPKVHPSFQENVYSYNIAAVYFEQKAYEKVKEVLSKISFEFEFIDVYYHISYKILLIKTYYETEDFIALEGSIESFRLYLIRNKSISERNGKAYNNFQKLVKRLINKKQGKKRTSNTLYDIVLNVQPIVHQAWLLCKAQELEKKKEHAKVK